jgi:hypothetical protein
MRPVHFQSSSFSGAFLMAYSKGKLERMPTKPYSGHYIGIMNRALSQTFRDLLD